jgi:hypothetical protein
VRRLLRVEGIAARRAAAAFGVVVEQFRRAGYAEVDRRGPLEAVLSAPSRLPLRLRLVPEGRVFGGTYGLEVATAEPVLPRTAGLGARGRGAVRLAGIRFRARRGDEAGRVLARRLEADGRLLDRLGRVHFERIRVEPDGRPVIRHMGGSLVWLLFPPLRRTIPLVSEQLAATVQALEAFRDAGRQV